MFCEQYIITHNDVQKDILIRSGIIAPIYTLEVLDFLGTPSIHNKSISKNSICFGANLSRNYSAFLYDLIDYTFQDLVINLYVLNR